MKTLNFASQNIPLIHNDPAWPSLPAPSPRQSGSMDQAANTSEQNALTNHKFFHATNCFLRGILYVKTSRAKKPTVMTALLKITAAPSSRGAIAESQHPLDRRSDPNVLSDPYCTSNTSRRQRSASYSTDSRFSVVPSTQRITGSSMETEFKSSCPSKSSSDLNNEY